MRVADWFGVLRPASQVALSGGEGEKIGAISRLYAALEPKARLLEGAPLNVLLRSASALCCRRQRLLRTAFWPHPPVQGCVVVFARDGASAVPILAALKEKRFRSAALTARSVLASGRSSTL